MYYESITKTKEAKAAAKARTQLWRVAGAGDTKADSPGADGAARQRGPALRPAAVAVRGGAGGRQPGPDRRPARQLPNVLLLGLDNLGEPRAAATPSDRLHRLRQVQADQPHRDTLVDIPDHGQNKLNAAYAFGGPELVMRTVNQNFGLNMMHYVAVDYRRAGGRGGRPGRRGAAPHRGGAERAQRLISTPPGRKVLPPGLHRQELIVGDDQHGLAAPSPRP